MQNRFHKKYYLLLFPLFLAACHPRIEQGFEKIPAHLNSAEELVRMIRPVKKYKYWACIRQDFGGKIHPETEIIAANGNISQLMNNRFDQPHSGFLTEMWKGYFYIVYMENDSMKLVTNRTQLISFIGKIDSLEEALLLAKIDNLVADYSRNIGGSYQKTRKGFEFYLARFHKCTVRTEPFKVSIDTRGNIKAKSLGFCYDVDDNICLD